jgi:predicted TIM-barrel fold metal-dependent hydrolase
VIVDIHTHVWEREHIPDRVRQELTGSRGWTSNLWPRIDGASRKKHLEATKHADKTVVFGWPAVIDVPNEFLSEYARSNAESIIAFASVDPHKTDAARELRHAVKELGLSGLKLYPITQHYYPNDSIVYPLCDVAQELEIPILWHLSPSHRRDAPLKFSQPLLLEDVAIAFPDLKMIIAHSGFPNEAITMAMLRKQPNVYTETSGCTTQPYRYYNTLNMAVDYGVTDKLLFGSDWPLFTFEENVNCLKNLNAYAEKTNLPLIPSRIIDQIINENGAKFLGS